MRHGRSTLVASVVTLLALVAAPRGQQAAEAPGGQATAAAKPSQPAPRTPDGRPDLQGTWDFRSPVPLERPEELAGKETLTKAEAEEFQRRRQEAWDKLSRIAVGLRTGYDTNVWFDNGWGHAMTRTSLLIDPADGRLPPMTADTRKRAAEAAVATEVAAGPEDRWLSERCMIGFNAGPPIMSSDYNNNLQVFQMPDQIVLLTEMIHEARIVPLDGRTHLPSSIRQWAGDSRGYWDGDTLVVDTINLLEKTIMAPGRPTGFGWRRKIADNGSDKVHIVERFTRLDVDTLAYEFTVDDPGTYTAPWTARVNMKKTMDPIYEYACHEGNYAMVGILSAARAVE